MKKIILVLAVFMLSVTVGYAQTNKKVYGPKAKNNKVWVNKSNKSTPQTAENERVTGATAKNNKTWATASKDAKKTEVSPEGEKIALKGPAAKNYKYHKNNNVESTPELSEPQYVENKENKESKKK